MMFSKLVLTEEERAVDPQVGYPLGYAKLCRHAAGQLQGLLTPFTEGPPQRFMPYSPQTEDFAKLKEWDSLFPVVAEADRDPPNARKYAEELWQQLDHLGNAGFDPVKFRVDSYGNVVYWNADPSSPLAWEIDHWFPHSRGGRTVVTNLRIVQWQANQRKKNRLEFLVPWWDLQHGCSINQFLSAFASKNADFRKRSFALFFSGGEDESVAREHVGECRPWPQQFREKKAQAGLAAAAIVTVPKDNEEVFRTCIASKILVVPDPPALSAVAPSAGTPARRRWSVEEEEALRRAVNKFGPGNWKEIKEYEPNLANRSTVQIKDKFRLMRGDWQNAGKENMGAVPTANGRSADHLDRQSAATSALQKELRVKIMREEEKREKEEEVVELEETVLKLRQQNEKERLSALELEAVLAKHKQRVEKQRRWAETQSSYRLCLERMIRDTMHQSISYKEQARLNQAACNALMARLDCQKVTCEAAEKDLLQRHSQRGVLETAAGDVLNNHGYDVLQKKSVTQGREIVDVSSCVSLTLGLEDEEGRVEQEIVIHPGDSDSEADETADEIYKLRQEQRRTKELVHQQQLQQAAHKLLEKSLDEVPVQEEDTKEAVQVSPSKNPVETITSPSRSSVLQEVIEAVKLVEESRESVRLQKVLDMKTQGSEGESEFADDEMSNEPHESQEHWKRDNTVVAKADLEPTCEAKLAVGKCTLGSITTNVKGNSLGAVLGRCEYMQAPVSEPVDILPVQSMVGETNADLKQEVQKNVIMVQTENLKVDMPAENIDSTTLYKQEYLDELLQQVRFQIPTMEVAEEPMMEDGLLRKSEEHLDQLLQQVLTTHLDRIRRNEAAQTIPDTDDEKVRQIGKSNLDKWLQVLLFKDVDSGGSSPGQESPLHRALSPALSQMSIAAMRGSVELQASRDQDLTKKTGEQNMEKPKGLWGGLLRKMSARHQSEQSLSTKLDEESDAEDAENPLQKQQQQQQQKKHGVNMDITDVLNSMSKISLGTEQPVGIAPPEGTRQLSESDQENSKVGPATSMRKCSDDCVVEELATEAWKAEGRVEDGIPGYLLDQNFPIERRYFPRPLSDVDEISETESLSSNHTADGFSNKDPNKMGLRASIKAASLVWKKAVKKLETRLQEGLIPPLPPIIAEGAAV